MYAKDMDPHRLGRAQQVIQRFILAKQPDDRYALVTFTFYSVVSSYLTRDPQAFMVYFDHLNQIEEPGWGSNMGAALVNGLRVFDADDMVNPQAKQKRRRLMIMISDGDDNVGQWQGASGGNHSQATEGVFVWIGFGLRIAGAAAEVCYGRHY
jgi:hypothetical protein